MKDLGVNMKLVQKFDTSDRRSKDAFFGFRKLFRDYLKKLNVVFFDKCCQDANEANILPVRFNATFQRLEVFNGSAWVDLTQINETTSTTTTTTV